MHLGIDIVKIILTFTSSKTGKIMITFKSETGNKKVEIVKNGNGGFLAKHIQLINTGLGVEESLIQMKSFNTFRSAEKWALKVL